MVSAEGQKFLINTHTLSRERLCDSAEPDPGKDFLPNGSVTGVLGVAVFISTVQNQSKLHYLSTYRIYFPSYK